MSKPAGRPRLRYRLLWLLVSPMVMLHLVWRSARDGGKQYLQQRLGFALPQAMASPRIWIHAASVGEINTAAPLIAELARQQPELHILVTTNTPTGREACLRVCPDSVTHCYLPLDFHGSVKRFLRRQAPQLGIVLETELWPELLHQASFPMALASARLSPKTLGHQHGWLGKVLKDAAAQFDLILPRDDNEIPHFKALGVDADRMFVAGDLKHSVQAGRLRTSPTPLINRDYALLASTHADEEIDIATEWARRAPQRLLVIAPRHIERADKIRRQLEQLGSAVACRSRQQAITPETMFYLADTYGELLDWYQHAHAIFVGGSLIARGGHNLLEPANLEKAAIVGPHTENFQTVVNAMLAEDALLQVTSAPAVVDALLDDWDKPEAYRQRGERAHKVARRDTEAAKVITQKVLAMLRANKVSTF